MRRDRERDSDRAWVYMDYDGTGADDRKDLQEEEGNDEEVCLTHSHRRGPPHYL